jgi:hypothetical protein
MKTPSLEEWREEHRGHDVTRSEVSPGQNIGPHFGASPKNPPPPKVQITLHCHDCHVDFVIDEA